MHQHPGIEAEADVRDYAPLGEDDIEALSIELDALREQIEASLDDTDRAYIERMIATQRALATAGRLFLFAGILPPAWLLGTSCLAVAKILENMEIGHNVMHGQWDWMNDPEIHSTTWEWDNTCPADQWRHSHNFVHHQYTNVLGKDRDVGYGLLRVSPDQKWTPAQLAQPGINVALALLFQWGVALHDIEFERIGRMPRKDLVGKLAGIGRKVRRQVTKDYLVFPLLAGPFAPFVFAGNLTANTVRNVWSYAIIFCGHFPDGAVRFTEEELEDESHGEWYLRQLLGSANISGSRLFHILSGSLGYQIEHHLFPDLPSNRYPEIAVRVRELCEKYDLPYTTGPLPRQLGQVQRTLLRLSFPTR